MLEPLPSEERRAYDYILPERRREGLMWLQWVIRLRWIAIAAQAITLAFAYKTLDSLALLAPLGAIMAMLVFVNGHATKVLQTTHGKDVSQAFLLNQLGVDVLALTGFFLLCGGPDNPFTMLYLVHVAMGMIFLHAQYAVSLVLLIVVSYTVLHVWSLPLHLDLHGIDEETLLRGGQWLAFTITVLSVSGFVLGMANSLRRHQTIARERGEGPAETEEVPHPEHAKG